MKEWNSEVVMESNGSKEKPVVRIREPKDGRPVSVYDNLESGAGDPDGTGRVKSVASQAPLMATTVPQNMAKPKLGERHTPTRNSLRHSRMIVLSKQVPRKYLPHVLRRHKLAKSLLVLQLLMGIAISTIAGWLLVWAPRLPVRDIPYWSGIPVLFSACIGLLLVCCCRKEYPGMPLACWVFSFKVFSILCSICASVASFCAFAFVIIHLLKLYSTLCEPANVMYVPCVCRTETSVFTYQDLNCPEVWNILSVLLIGSGSANFIAGFLSSWYIYLHWSSRYYYLYSQIPLNPTFISS